jgi:hypothetical protein
MNLTAYTREHHFYVAIAKHVFLHAEKGIVFVSDPIRLKDAEKFDLKPLVLYGLTVPGTQIEWCTFSLSDKPRSLFSVLLEGWEKASGLRGYPDTLKINRHIANACPHLQSSLDHIGGISLAVADGKDKQFSASLRVAQQRGLELGWHNRDGHVINDVKELNDHALNVHNEHINGRRWERIGNNSVKERASEWMGLPFNASNAVSDFSKLDWVGGSWLSSWELNIPQNQKLHFWRHEINPGCYWLLSGEDENIDYITDEDWDRRCALKAKILIDCWPNKPGDIANAIGITAKQLLWFLNGQAALSETERDDLSELLGIEASTDFVDYDVIGPCALITEGPKKCSNAYDELSNGGDIEYSVEVLPEKRTPDPSWRYVVFSAYGRLPNIFMFRRGSKTTDQLGEKLLMNYQGERKVPAAIYRDVVSTCAQCSTDPLLNRKLMTAFGERHKQYFREMGMDYHTWR